jgi:hypothetical protein
VGLNCRMGGPAVPADSKASTSSLARPLRSLMAA